MYVLTVTFLIIVQQIICKKNIFIGESLDFFDNCTILGTLQEFAQFYETFKKEFENESEVFIWLTAGKSYVITSKIKYDTPNRLTISAFSKDQELSPASLIKIATQEETFHISDAMVFFENIDFNFEGDDQIILNMSPAFLIINSPKISIINSTLFFQLNAEKHLHRGLIQAVDSYLILENFKFSHIFFEEGAPLVRISGKSSLSLISFIVADCYFNATSLILAINARDISLKDVIFLRNRISSSNSPFIFGSSINKIQIFNLSFESNDFKMDTTPSVNIEVEGDISFVGITELSFKNNAMNTNSIFAQVSSYEGVSLFRINKLVAEGNSKANTYFSFKHAKEIEITDSIFIKNIGKKIVLLENFKSTLLVNNEFRDNNYESLYRETDFLQESLVGTCVYMSETGNKYLSQMRIINNKGINTSPGVWISDKEVIGSLIILTNSEFLNNTLFFNTKGEFSVSLHVLSNTQTIELRNCIFRNNEMNSTSSLLGLQAGGPCGVFKSENAAIYIYNSIFQENQSKFHSTCLILVGGKVKVEGSSFSYNHVIFDLNDYIMFERIKKDHAFIEKLAEGNRGCLFASSVLVEVTESLFYSNRNFRGGIVVDGYWNSSLNIYFTMTKTNFSKNIANACNSIYPGAMVVSFHSVIQNCYFYYNKAGGNAVAVTLNFYVYSTILISDSVFFRNYAELAGIASFQNNDQVVLNNNIFMENGAISLGGSYPPSVSTFLILSNGESHAFFVRNIFQNNWSALRACVYCMSSSCHFINEIFIRNEAYSFAGIHASEGTITISKCIFFMGRTTLNGGCLSNYFSSMFVYDTVLSNCRADAKGGCFFGSQVLELVMKNCTISQSVANSGSVISTYLASKGKVIWLISNSVIFNNTADSDLFQVSETKLIINNSLISLANINVFRFEESQADLINVSFTEVNCRMNFFGCAIFGTRSKINLVNTLMLKILNKVDAAGVALYETELSIENSLFFNITTKMESSVISSNALSKVTLSLTIFVLYNNICLFINEGVLKISQAIFQNLKTSNTDLNSAIYCQFCSEVTISNSSFINNTAVLGAGIYIHSEISLNTTVFDITDSFFLENKADHGGAIYVEGGFGTISNNRFFSNVGTQTGGSICLIATPFQAKAFIKIVSNEFKLNEAEFGSILKWDLIEPLFLFNDYIEGDKELSNELVSLPIELKLFVEEQAYSTHNQGLLNEISSGLPLSFKLKLVVLDTYGKAFLKIEKTNFAIALKRKDALYTDELVLFGHQSIEIINGELDLTSLSISGPENVSFYMLISLEGIEKFYEDYILDESHKIDQPAHININGKYYFRIPFRFKSCSEGEVYSESTLSCKICPIGSYSLSSDEPCKRCPQGAICHGGANISVKKGFWRRNRESLSVISCEELSEYCLEAEVSKCSLGYKGPLCGSCEQLFTRNNLNGCSKCDNSKAYTYLKILLYLLTLFGVCVLMIKSSLKNSNKIHLLGVSGSQQPNPLLNLVTKADSIPLSIKSSIPLNIKTLNPLSINTSNPLSIKPSKPPSQMINSKNLRQDIDFKSTYYKILVNFVQLIGIVRSLKISWPGYFDDYMDFLHYLSLFSVKLLSLECLTSQSSGIPFEFKKVLILNTIFVIFFALICVFWFLWGRLKNARVKRKILVSFLIIYEMMQPTLVSELANILICKEIENQLFLSEDTSVSCEDEQYNMIAYTIFLPLLIIWSVALPLYLLYLLKRKSSRLYESSVFSVFGIFYSSYRRKYYYWDFLIMARENIVIYILVIRINIILKLNIIAALLALFTYFQITRKPFLTKTMNTLEEYALYVSLYIIFLSFNQVYKPKEGYILVGTILMIIVFILFICLWLFEYILVVKRDVGKFIQSSKFLQDIITKRTTGQKPTVIVQEI